VMLVPGPAGLAYKSAFAVAAATNRYPLPGFVVSVLRMRGETHAAEVGHHHGMVLAIQSDEIEPTTSFVVTMALA